MDKDKKQNEIFDAALKLFALYGFKKTTLEDVAEEVGMTKSNLYFYVKSKRDLYEQTVSRSLRRWRDSVGLAIAKTDDVVEKFTVMARQSFEYLAGDDDLRAISIKDPNIFTLTPGEDRFYVINLGAMQMLKSILLQGIEEGRFYPVNVEHTTELLFSAYIMFLIKTYVKSEGVSSVGMYDEGLKIILRGLCRDHPVSLA